MRFLQHVYMKSSYTDRGTSIFNGGAICRDLSPISQTGPALASHTRDETSSGCIFGELVAQESLLFFTMVQCTLVNGSLPRKQF